MITKRALPFLLLAILATGCAQVESLIASIPDLAPPASSSPTAPTMTSTTALPTQTPAPPTISPTPTITPTPRPTNTPRPSLTPSVTIPPLIRIGPENIPEFYNPLTGLPVANPNLLERRPIAIKVSNYPHSVRPQSGLSLADNVYEYYLEDGITRFIAIFYGNDASKVGSIRSGRLFDEHIARMYNAILVFNSADDKVIDYFMSTDLVQRLVVDRDCPPICRDTERPYPHNLFGNTREITEYIEERGSDNSRPNLESNFFYSLGGRTKSMASDIYVTYSYASYARWTFDFSSRRYHRYQGSEDNLGGGEGVYTLLTDDLTGEPIGADNVVILFVPHEFYYKSSDTEIFSINLVDSGPAYVFRDGKAYPAKWVRKAEDRPLSILTEGGAPFPLKPGITYFQVMSADSTFTKTEPLWWFEFVRPVYEEDEGE